MCRKAYGATFFVDVLNVELQIVQLQIVQLQIV
jgi:hypothetical protein